MRTTDGGHFLLAAPEGRTLECAAGTAARDITRALPASPDSPRTAVLYYTLCFVPWWRRGDLKTSSADSPPSILGGFVFTLQRPSPRRPKLGRAASGCVAHRSASAVQCRGGLFLVLQTGKTGEVGGIILHPRYGGGEIVARRAGRSETAEKRRGGRIGWRDT